MLPDIVDKTASFVARNGPEFEARIRQNELGNPKFNFLNTGDPYHAYYQHKVQEIREGKGNILILLWILTFLLSLALGVGFSSLGFLIMGVICNFLVYHCGPITSLLRRLVSQ